MPIVDVNGLGEQLLASQDQLLNALPGDVQIQAGKVAETVKELAKSLPSFDSLLSPGQHYGLDLTVPKTIEIVPPRMITGTVNSVLSQLGNR